MLGSLKPELTGEIQQFQQLRIADPSISIDTRYASMRGFSHSRLLLYSL